MRGDGARGRVRRQGRCWEMGFCAWEKHKKGRDVRKNFRLLTIIFTFLSLKRVYIREDCLVLRVFCLGLLTFAISGVRGAGGMVEQAMRNGNNG